MPSIDEQFDQNLRDARRRRLAIIKNARGINPSDGYRLHYMGIYALPDDNAYYVYEVTNVNERGCKTGLRDFALVECETEEYRAATNEEMFGFMDQVYQKSGIDERLFEMMKTRRCKNVSGCSERIEGATPNGGDYSEAFYFDENHNPCSKEDAYYVDIHECTNDGRVVDTVQGICK